VGAKANQQGVEQLVRDDAESQTIPPTTEPPEGGGGGGGGGGQSSNLFRVTVNLTSRAHGDLQKISANTGLGKTDVINRALQVYALVEELLDKGGGSLLIRHPDGEHERIYIL
jgi:hypothetical protein